MYKLQASSCMPCSAGHVCRHPPLIIQQIILLQLVGNSLLVAALAKRLLAVSVFTDDERARGV